MEFLPGILLLAFVILIVGLALDAAYKREGKTDELRSEYTKDFIQSGVRGKYGKAYREATNIALIDPDLHELFPDSQAVNRALRHYVETQRTAT